MSENHHPPGLPDLLQRVAKTASGVLQNRAELASLEWQQEKARLVALLVWAGALVFLAVAGTLLLTAVIIFVCPEDWRVYVAALFTLLYLVAAVGAWVGLKKLLCEKPFSETVNQLKKDGLWLDTFRTRN